MLLQENRATKTRKEEPIEQRVENFKNWISLERFKFTRRLHTPLDVILQQGLIIEKFDTQSQLADEFYNLLREHFEESKYITAFCPYSPVLVVVWKNMGINVG